jgi:hypothetical protein
MRRRLLFGALFLGAVLLLATVSVLRVGVWARDGLGRRRAAPWE